MKIIGICGRSGSGKSTVCKIFQDRGITVLDCDKIYHKLIASPSPCLEAIENRFGKSVIVNGHLDRKKLKEIVFHDNSALSDLNAITHKFVLDELNLHIENLNKEGARACVIDAPLFFEAHLETRCHLVCAVICKTHLQIDRICKRDGIPREEAILRLEKQISSDELRRRCDYVIENNGNEEELRNNCIAFLESINL